MRLLVFILFMFNISNYEILPIYTQEKVKIEISNNILITEISKIPKKGYSLILYNIYGKEIITKIGEKKIPKLILNIENIKKGRYILRLQDNKDNSLIQSYSMKKL